MEVPLADGERAWLCGSHALLHSRTTPRPKTEAELKAALRDRRGRRDRRHADDELGAMLAAAFSGGRRLGDRRRA